MHNILIIGNIVVPLISGLFFLLLFLYFTLVKPTAVSTHKYFALYLISFSIFVVGRPLQLLLGPHPLPLIICNFRFFLLCSVCAPAALLTTGTFTKSKDRGKKFSLFFFGSLLGGIYIIFNTLGTPNSYEFLRIGGIIAYDNLTPNLVAPCYGREITLLVQLIVGFGLAVSSCFKIVNAKIIKRNSLLTTHTFFLFNYGILFFGFLLFLGTLVKHWWIIYCGSMISAIIVSRGVLLDIKEVLVKMERVIPFLKEEFIQNISFSSASEAKIQEIIQLLGKESFFDTFFVIKISDGYDKYQIQNEDDLIQETISETMLERLGKEDFLIMSLGSDRLAVCLSLLSYVDRNPQLIIDLTEQIRVEVERRTPFRITMGIGRSYDKVENLRLSFQEASNALDYALAIGENHVVQVTTIQKMESVRLQYPLRQHEKLLLAIRNGKVEETEVVLNDFISKMDDAYGENFDILKVKIIEFLHLMIEAGGKGGVDEKRLLDLNISYFNDLAKINTNSNLISWFKKTCHQIVALVAACDKDRTHVIVKSAKAFIEDNYQRPITINEVAQKMAITPSHLMHLFKQKTGSTFGDYLMTFRMKKAIELLTSTELSIAEVANQVGYQDSNYFSRIFKNFQGMAPSEFKKNNCI